MKFLLFKFVAFIVLITSASFSYSQSKYTLSGYVKDAGTGEYLIGANVFLKENLRGTTTNTYGFYSLTYTTGSFNLVVKYIGYKDYIIPVNLDKNQTINISLESIAIESKEVVITGERSDKNIQSTQMSSVELEVEKIKSLPAFMGEVDILKTIQYLPGVQSAGEGNSGFYVRGGGPDQNLILLDEAVVYNASHLFGFFSVFNSDAVKSINLIKGGMPAQFGGRLASVLDISMNEGNNREYHASGGIGLIASRFTVEGPIKKDTSSFIISGRRTYFDIITKPFINEDANAAGSSYYFYDLNTKLNYRLSDKDRLFLSGYFGRDVFNFKNKESGFSVNIPWGNATGSLRWNHLFNPRLFINTSLIFSDYNFEFGAGQSEFEFRLFSGIRDYTAKVDLSYYPTLKHNLKFGGQYIFHRFTPSNASARSGEVQFDFGKIVRLYANDASIYINDEYEINDKLKINVGLRGTYFQQIGPFTRYIKDSFGATTDTIMYEDFENVKTYNHIEPRASLRYSINNRSSVKAAYTQNYQYIHLASLSSVSLPTDIWVPSSSIVQPQYGVQYTTGYFRNFLEDKFETSIEVYYKEMDNQVEYKEGALPEDNVSDNADNNFTFGSGKSYGVELFFKKRTGNLTGWIGYTLSNTTRVFPEINLGKEFPAKYDRRHDLSIVATYDLNKKWTFGAVFVYATGNALTLPVSWYVINGHIVNEYGERNSYRMIPYHRLDISATYHVPKKKRIESSWNFSIFNVYNRKNPYFIYFDNEGDLTQFNLKVTAYQVSLFPIIPSVTWNFKW